METSFFLAILLSFFSIFSPATPATEVPAVPTEGSIVFTYEGNVFRKEDGQEYPALAISNYLFGYVNSDLELVTPYKFEDAFEFYDGFAAVKEPNDGGYDYIDVNGNYISDYDFDSAHAFSEGFAIVQKDDKIGFLKSDGTMLTGFEYTDATGFNMGYATVYGDFGCRLIDTELNTILEVDTGYLRIVGENRLAIYDENNFAILSDFQGNKIGNETFGYIGYFINGLAEVGDGGVRGYIDMNGNLILEPEYDLTREFSGGFAAVGYSGESEGGLPPRELIGFVNGNGEFITEIEYDWASNFSEGLAAVFTYDGAGRSGYIDTNGDMVIPNIYYKAGDFSGGFAVVAIQDENLDTLYGVIDQSGNYVIEPIYFAIHNAGNGTFAVRNFDMNSGVLDASGNVLVPFEYDYVYHQYDNFFTADKDGVFTSIKLN